MISGNMYGAGSRLRKKKAGKISHIARMGLTRPRYSLLFLSLIDYFRCRNVVELGTSLGLNTLYLAKGKYLENLITFEGNHTLAEIAQANFKTIPDPQIELIIGDIDHTLSDSLKKFGTVDFAYVDANHTAEATILYVEEMMKYLSRPSILVIDDIYWSADMAKAWSQICLIPQKPLCLDLFQVGVLIFHDEGPDGYYHLVY
jgi:predicted O-methyltransferase YrrM